MKKGFKILGVLVLVLVLVMVALPWLFRDRIAGLVVKNLRESVNAQVILDPARVSLSLFSDFPDFTMEVRSFGLINRAPFAGDTLFFAESFTASLGFMSVVGGGPLRISSVELVRPRVRLLVLPDGTASYDIAVPDTARAAEKPAEASSFGLEADHWAIRDGDIAWADARSGSHARITGLDHTGSGNLSASVAGLKTRTRMADLSLTLDSVNYLRHKTFESEIEAEWDRQTRSVVFGENFLQLNDFRFSFAGKAALKDGRPVFDLTFRSPATDIRGLLSLVPSLNTGRFREVETGGSLSFSGSVRGTYDSLSLPSFRLALGIDKGLIRYPGMPGKLEQIQADIEVSHKQGNLEQIETRIGTLAFRMGGNPFALSGTVSGLSRPRLGLKAKGTADLAQLLAVFPVEGWQARGLLNLDLAASGLLDLEHNLYPVVNAALILRNGYLRTAGFPHALEKVELEFLASNPGGSPAGSRAEIRSLHFEMEGQPFRVKAAFQNPADLSYDVSASGKINLATLTRFFPVEGLKMTGLLDLDLQTRGILSDVTRKNYASLPTSGRVVLSAFTCQSEHLTRPVSVSRAAAEFSSREIRLGNMAMTVGRSDLQLSGSLRNPLGYFLRGETLAGKLNLQSGQTDAGELMSLTGEPAPPEPGRKDAPLTASSFPANLELDFSGSIGTLLYDNLKMENARGRFGLRNGVLTVGDMACRTLGGEMGAEGSYDPRNPDRPAFDFTFVMKRISIPLAWEAFNTLRVLAPGAKGVDGNLSTRFSFRGFLRPGMQPEPSTLSGSGLVSVGQVRLRDMGLIDGVNKLAGTRFPDATDAQDLKMQVRIRDGRLYFDPFALRAGNQVLNVGGSNGLDGTVDYRITTSVPAGQAGAAVSSGLRSLTGKSLAGNPVVNLEIAATGQAASPRYRLVKADAGTAGEQVKSAVQDKIGQAKAEAEARAREEARRLQAEAEARAKAEAERLRKEAEDKARKEVEKLKKRFRF